MCTMCTPLPMGLSLPSHETDIPSNSLDRGEGKFTGRSRNFGKGKRGEGGGGLGDGLNRQIWKKWRGECISAPKDIFSSVLLTECFQTRGGVGTLGSLP